MIELATLPERTRQPYTASPKRHAHGQAFEFGLYTFGELTPDARTGRTITAHLGPRHASWLASLASHFTICVERQ
jgi:hypothetical protein